MSNKRWKAGFTALNLLWVLWSSLNFLHIFNILRADVDKCQRATELRLRLIVRWLYHHKRLIVSTSCFLLHKKRNFKYRLPAHASTSWHFLIKRFCRTSCLTSDNKRALIYLSISAPGYVYDFTNISACLGLTYDISYCVEWLGGRRTSLRH
jgi:hypothetical protein